jgi:hypothetical protein
MRLVEVVWKPTDRQLRQFAMTLLVALPLLGWLWRLDAQSIAILAGVGVALAGLGFLSAPALKPVFIGLSLITLPIGLVIGELVLALVFFGVIWPLAAFFRFVGRDVLQRKLEPGALSYWQPKSQPAGTGSYFTQS